MLPAGPEAEEAELTFSVAGMEPGRGLAPSTSLGLGDPLELVREYLAETATGPNSLVDADPPEEKNPEELVNRGMEVTGSLTEAELPCRTKKCRFSAPLLDTEESRSEDSRDLPWRTASRGE